MAYFESIAVTDSQPMVLPTARNAVGTAADFSPLEWSIIRLSRQDRLWTIRRLGPIRRLWNSLIGRGNPQLANDRLEALRRMAVLSWNFGFTVHGRDVADFLAAGFSPEQYELLVSSIRSAAGAAARPISQEVFA